MDNMESLLLIIGLAADTAEQIGKGTTDRLMQRGLYEIAEIAVNAYVQHAGKPLPIGPDGKVPRWDVDFVTR